MCILMGSFTGWITSSVTKGSMIFFGSIEAYEGHASKVLVTEYLECLLLLLLLLAQPVVSSLPQASLFLFFSSSCGCASFSRLARRKMFCKEANIPCGARLIS